MIKDGRPYTIENGCTDAALLTDLPYYDADRVMLWIRENVIPANDVCTGRSSYGMKHLLDSDIKQYLTNNQFKDAMLLSGYHPADPNELNWHYRAVLKRDVILNPSPFYHWVQDNYAGKDSPEGDFAEDMARKSSDFPMVADYQTIRSYLTGRHACDGAIRVFKSLWKRYEAAGISHVPMMNERSEYTWKRGE